MATITNNNEHVTRASILKKYKKKTPMQEIMARFFRNRLAIIGLVLFSIVLIFACLSEVLRPYDLYAVKMNIKDRLQHPNATYWFGTDEAGRDVFARIIHGARISLTIAFVSTAFAVITGGIIGAVSGYFGGWLDNVIMRVMDVFMCLPNILLAMAIVAAFGSNIPNLIIAMSISKVPGFSRTVRSAVMTVRGQEYVEAARAIGMPVGKIIASHMVPNASGPIIVSATSMFATSLLGVSSLSFLGLGVNPPTPEWGNMLSSGRLNMRDHPHLVLAPGLSVFVTIFALNCLGDGLRDALDPKLKK